MKRRFAGNTGGRVPKRPRRNKTKPTKLIAKVWRYIKKNKPEVKQGHTEAVETLYPASITTAPHAFRIASMITQGDGESQFEGKRIHAKYLTIKYDLTNAAQALKNLTSYDMCYPGRIVYNMYIISVPGTQTTFTDINTITDSRYSHSATCHWFDADKVKIHARKTIKINSDAREDPFVASYSVQGTPKTKFGTFNWKINQDWTFQDVSTRVLAKRQYFFVGWYSGVAPEDVGGAAQNQHGFSFNKLGWIALKYKLYFSDN